MTAHPRLSRPRQRSILTILLCLAGLVLGPLPEDPSSCTSDPGQDKTAPFPRKGSYTGKERCEECHEDFAERVGKSPHAGVLDSPAVHACEACHGPGTAHAEHEDNEPERITYPRALDMAGQMRLCGTCHKDQIRSHGGDMAGFIKAGKTCTDCHEIHAATKSPAHPGLDFASLHAANAKAKPTGAQRCLTCHPLRDTLLHDSAHHRLQAKADPKGCETCHGHGDLHVQTGGLTRLITRPDTASDGIQTCRSCHQDVDPVEFHWKGRRQPLLSEGMRCTSCHTVHQASDSPRRNSHRGGATNARCATCHEPAFAVLEGTIHESLGGRDTPLEQGCGSCHQGALAHAEAGGRKSLVDSLHGSTAKHQLQTCAKCHSGDQALAHARKGAHFKNEVTCLSCHSPAAPKTEVRRDAEKRCADCHQGVAARFRLPHSHPVALQGKAGKHQQAGQAQMGCTDCHEPHSARPRIRDRQLRQDNCVKCHKQYREPFTFAHQASRADGCVACHSPHGSSNKRMLKQVNSQQNCLQCHADFPSFHDQSNGAVFTNCLNCHTQVHGSNHSRYLFR